MDDPFKHLPADARRAIEVVQQIHHLQIDPEREAPPTTAELAQAVEPQGVSRRQTEKALGFARRAGLVAPEGRAGWRLTGAGMDVPMTHRGEC